jgi:hypothetical protein
MKIVRNRLLPLGAALLLLMAQAAHGKDRPRSLAELFTEAPERFVVPPTPVTSGWQDTYTKQSPPIPLIQQPPPIRHKTVMSTERGGKLDEHWNRFKALYLSGHEIEVRGRCPSACTLITGVIPKDRLCFAEGSNLMFHWARTALTEGRNDWQGTTWMLDHIAPDLREWIEAMGGIEKLPKQGFWVLPASILWGMGYRRCGARPSQQADGTK